MLSHFKHLQWWKYLAIILMLFTIIAGMILPVPRLAILNETIRNQYFHVPMWFGMIIMQFAALVLSMRYLMTYNMKFDRWASELTLSGLLFGVLGLTTGMIWANYTWGEPWSGDPKQNLALISQLIYAAYFILRGAIPDIDRSARVSAVFNIFAYVASIALIMILPRMVDSLHPGSGGNPGFSNYDLDNTMKMVFYPSVIAWTLVGLWLAELGVRLKKVKEKKYMNSET